MRDQKYWRRLMESAPGEEVPEEEKGGSESTDEVMMLDELVFPYDLTLRLTNLFEDPVYKRDELGDAYGEFLLKLFRSVRYWRIPTPRWLSARLINLGVIQPKL